MQVKLDEFKQGYVVVPKYSDEGYGIVRVVRGDMTDQEWNTWRKLCSVREVVRLTNDYKKSGQPCTGMSAHIIKFLTEQGIPVCLTETQRPM